MNPVIEVSHLSKSYKISHQTDMKAGYHTIKDDFANLLKKPIGGGSAHTDKETFWALDDVSFEVAQGEAFGIIGKNGSGKSTLLKILSRIVEPSKGHIKLTGRVASLLEVGTGFHPELTGRENIYFNGSMLGMSRQEIRSKFNEIVDFSEIERFLDTPVKFYSSGMYVRLAFAVAAHLDPEILILDEVLAVGDADFQRKSMDKMLSIARGGRTILYVSHGLDSVEGLCDKTIWLHKGKIKAQGDTTDVIDKYLGRVSKKNNLEQAKGSEKKIQIKGVRVLNDGNEPSKVFSSVENINVEIEYQVMDQVQEAVITCDLYSSDGTPVFGSTDADVDSREFFKARMPGHYKARLTIPKNLLTGREYFIVATAQRPTKIEFDRSPEARFKVKITDEYFRSDFVPTTSPFGLVTPIYKWSTDKKS